MSFKVIERTIVDFFEANGADTDLDNSTNEYFLDGLSIVDSDISLSGLALAIGAALKTALRDSGAPTASREPVQTDATQPTGSQTYQGEPK